MQKNWLIKTCLGVVVVDVFNMVDSMNNENTNDNNIQECVDNLKEEFDKLIERVKNGDLWISKYKMIVSLERFRDRFLRGKENEER